jgi:hypothetical protein
MQAQEIHPESKRAPAALELARGFIATLHADAPFEEREQIESTILCAGQHLYERARPGDWSAFEPVSFLIAMNLPSAEAEAHACYTMIGFIGWCAFHGFVDCGAAARIVLAIEESSPSEAPVHAVLSDLARTTAGLLEELDGVQPPDAR